MSNKLLASQVVAVTNSVRDWSIRARTGNGEDVSAAAGIHADNSGCSSETPAFCQKSKGNGVGRYVPRKKSNS